MKITIYSIDGCMYCKAAEELAKSLDKITYKVVKVKDSDKEKTIKKNMWPTFPQVFFNKELIGGFNEFYSVCVFIGMLKSKINKKDLGTLYDSVKFELK